ncbi:MAG: hypothetical protein V4579_00215 [Pseudomonadota bacterium]
MLMHVGPLPDDPLAAAAAFHADVVPRVIAELAAGTLQLILVFTPAGHRHRAWREAAIQTMARELAPVRINAVATVEPAPLLAAEAYIARAPGLTGQYLPLDSQGAGGMVHSPP